MGNNPNGIICLLWEQGSSVKDISKETGFSEKHIKGLLKEMNPLLYRKFKD